MARRIKRPEHDSFKFQPKAGFKMDEIKVVGEGDRAYLWIGLNDQCVANASGPETLRKVAESILSRLGPRSR